MLAISRLLLPRVLKAILWLTASALVLYAIMALIIQYYVRPTIHSHQQKIVHHAEAVLHRKVTVSGIKLGWHTARPQLRLSDVKLYDESARIVLELPTVEADISWLSIWRWEPYLSSLNIKNTRLTIQRDATGKIWIAGISLQDNSDPTMMDWLLQQPHIRITDSIVTWQDSLTSAPPLTLQQVDLTLSSSFWGSFFKYHTISLRGKPVLDSRPSIAINGHFTGGSITNLEQWFGKMTVHATAVDVTDIPKWLPLPWQVHRGQGTLRADLEFHHLNMQKIALAVTLHDMELQQATYEPLSWKNLSAKAVWERLPNKEKIQIQDIQINSPNLRITNGTIALESNTVQNTQQGSVSLDQVTLGQVSTIARYFPLPENFQMTLQGTNPQANIENMKLTWQWGRHAPLRFTFNSEIKSLSTLAYQRLPGITNLSGRIQGNERGGFAMLETQHAQIDLQQVFRWPIPLDELTAKVNWQLQNDQIYIDIEKLSVKNKHLSCIAQAKYRTATQGPGIINLSATLNDVNGQYTPYYLPKVLTQQTLHSLDTLIIAGTGQNAKVTIKGDLAQFPWKNNQGGVFEVIGDVSHAVIDYTTNWPRIRDAKLRLIFQGNTLKYENAEGVILDTRITQASGIIPALEEAIPVLSTQGIATGPASDLLQYINDTPLLSLTNNITQSWQTAGNGKLALNLHIPLDPQKPQVKLHGTYDIDNGSLSLVKNATPLSHIRAHIKFTESDLQARQVQAHILDMPVQMNLRKEGVNIVVEAAGTLTPATIHQLAPENPLGNRIHGTSTWHGLITVQNHHSAQIRLTSSLLGMMVDLPAPLHKDANEKLDVSIEAALDDHHIPVLFVYGKRLSTWFSMDRSNQGLTLTQAKIQLGGLATPPQAPGIYIEGTLGTFNADAWQAILTSQSGQTHPPVKNVAVHFDKMILFQRQFHDVALQATPADNTWQIDVNSKETKGLVTYDTNTPKITANFTRLVIPDGDLSSREISANTNPKNLYPKMEIYANNFSYNNLSWQKLKLLAAPQDSRWVIQQLELASPDNMLAVDGVWYAGTRNPDTQLNFNWKIQDVGKTLSSLGSPDTIGAGKAEITGSLKWPNAPDDFSLLNLKGQMTLTAQAGRFLKIHKASAKLLSLISLQNLPQRLLLDFSDLFKSGYHFSKITGDLVIQNGLIRSDNLEMTGPAAIVKIKGEANFIHETQNLHLKIIPNVDNTLSLAAFAGGPLVGSAAFILQKILSNPINKIASYEYDITGSWSEPVEKSSYNKKGALPSPELR